jgi:formamidopyrimidine-DNA glycosylase
MTGRRILDVRRRGKWIIVDLSGGAHLLLHLGMTGQLIVISSQAPAQPHTHLRFSLDRGRQELRFRDVRRFGSAAFFEDSPMLESFFQDRSLGPEPFELEPGYWHSRLSSTERSLKAVLLDQSVVAGVGNIYADSSA